MHNAPPERHDFRVGAVDLEVKSTRSAMRHHVVHGLRQLEPSEGHRLFLVSLRFDAAGLQNGLTLGMRVSMLRGLLPAGGEARKTFESKLLMARYCDDDDAQYPDRTILADTPLIILVDDACPRLVPSSLRQALGAALASRVDHDVTYRINVDGLGSPINKSDDAKLLRLSQVE